MGVPMSDTSTPGAVLQRSAFVAAYQEVLARYRDARDLHALHGELTLHGALPSALHAVREAHLDALAILNRSVHALQEAAAAPEQVGALKVKP